MNLTQEAKHQIQAGAASLSKAQLDKEIDRLISIVLDTDAHYLEVAMAKSMAPIYAQMRLRRGT